MIREIEMIVEEEDANRFLGAIIAVRRVGHPSAPQPLEIVDGQQRLTTLYLFVLTTAQVAESFGYHDYARSLLNRNLIVDWYQNGCNTKLIPSYPDRSQFCSIFEILYKTGTFDQWLPVRTHLPHRTGEPTGKLLEQFHRIQSYLRRVCKERGEQGLMMVAETARTKLTYVFIQLKEPSSATTVFEGLNDQGIPAGVGDLVRNDVFSRLGDDVVKAGELHSQQWLPFNNRLGTNYDGFFFPYCVTLQPNATRANMFRELRKFWGESNAPTHKTAGEIIAHMEEYSGPYLSIVREPSPHYSRELQRSISRLNRMSAPAAVYPFIMRLLHEFNVGALDEKTVVECTDLIEAFLGRRALCGVEPTGLLSVFRSLWRELSGNVSASRVADHISSRRTVDWPNDDRLQESVIRRPLYNSAICNYILNEFERSNSADVPVGVNSWIEHIVPQKLTTEWGKNFGADDHKKYVHTWANLVLLSDNMNRDLSVSIYPIKQQEYARNSAFRTARQVAEDYAIWDVSTLLDRADKLAKWANLRWPKPGAVGARSSST